MNIYTNEEEALRLALHALRPTATFGMIGMEPTNWDISITMPTQTEIDLKIIELKAEYDALEYQRLREKAYPSLAEQADMQYHDTIDSTTVWIDTIASIKAMFPKPV